MTQAVLSALAAAFVQGLDQQQLRYQSCESCGAAQTLARYACHHCGASALAWRVASGEATVRAVTVVGRAPSEAFRALAPYTLVLVELDEGSRLMAHAEPGVGIGDRVRAGFFKHQDRTLIRFTLI